MTDVSLRYGEGRLTLRKSTSLIALRPEAGPAADRLIALSDDLVEPAHFRPALGGFQLVGIKDPQADRADATLDRLREHAAIAVGTHVYHTSDDGVPFVPTGQVYVECVEDASVEVLRALFDEHALRLVEARGERAFVLETSAASKNPVKVAIALQQSPYVTVAEPELASPGQLRAFVPPTDELLAEQWHLQNTGYHRGTDVFFIKGADARVVEAWKRAETLGSPDVVVGIIDDGFDLGHPDLVGDGKIVAPWDFVRNNDQPLPAINRLGDWHGTACAGVALGGANGTGIVGAAPDCRLMPVRWSGGLEDSEVEAWFDWVTAKGAWVVSCSWGPMEKVFPLSTRTHRALARCAREGRNGLGCVICFAAGNDNRDVHHPEGKYLDGFVIHPDVLAVAASTSRDQKAHYSSFGKEIAVCAPSSGAGGAGIVTSDVRGYYRRGALWLEAGYAPGAYGRDFGGTSSACPLVAGICALLLSIKPQLTAAEVRELVKKTARRIGDPSTYGTDGHSPYHGYGCIDALAAVEALVADVTTEAVLA